MTKKATLRKNSPVIPLLSLPFGRALGVVMIVAGCLMLMGGDKPVPFSLPNSDESLSVYVDTPSEVKPTPEQEQSYKVSAREPRTIDIPSISSHGLIQKVGILADATMAVPGNVHFAGWYTSSSLPGEPGVSILDGHVSGKKSDGIFRHLDALNEGDRFTVEYGDMSKKEFEVKSVKTMDEADATGYLFEADPAITSQLNLITCGGTYDRKQQTYTKRTIVVSSLVN